MSSKKRKRDEDGEIVDEDEVEEPKSKKVKSDDKEKKKEGEEKKKVKKEEGEEKKKKKKPTERKHDSHSGHSKETRKYIKRVQLGEEAKVKAELKLQKDKSSLAKYILSEKMKPELQSFCANSYAMMTGEKLVSAGVGKEYAMPADSVCAYDKSPATGVFMWTVEADDKKRNFTIDFAKAYPSSSPVVFQSQPMGVTSAGLYVAYLNGVKLPSSSLEVTAHVKGLENNTWNGYDLLQHTAVSESKPSEYSEFMKKTRQALMEVKKDLESKGMAAPTQAEITEEARNGWRQHKADKETKAKEEKAKAEKEKPKVEKPKEEEKPKALDASA